MSTARTLRDVPAFERGMPLRQWQLARGHQRLTQQEIDEWVRRVRQQEEMDAKRYGRRARQ